MTIRIHAGPPLALAAVVADDVASDLKALVDEIGCVLRPAAAHLLVAMLDHDYLGLACAHVTLRETLIGDFRVGPVMPGLHAWLRRVVAHTVGVSDGVNMPDRDTAVLAAFCRELAVCTQTPPEGLTLSAVIERGPLPGAAAFLVRLAESLHKYDSMSAEEAARLERVIDTIRALEWHPWIPLTSPAAALALAGRATAAAMIHVPDATGAIRMPIRATLARVDFGPVGAINRPAFASTAATVEAPF